VKVTWHEEPGNRRHTRTIITLAEFHELIAAEDEAAKAEGQQLDRRDLYATYMTDTSPVGAALMAAEVGEIVTVDTAVGRKTLTLEKRYD
jgi:transcription elongation GreA/GreB family factor